MRCSGRLPSCWLLFAQFAAIACGEPLFEENWNSGRIDPAKWNASAGNGVMQVEPIGGGDYALAMAGRLDWTAYIYSVRSFSRGDHLRVTFKVWGDERRVSPDGVALFPVSAGITGPWHGSNKGPIYSTIDEAIDMWWDIMRLGENRVYQKGPLLSQAFMRALAAARSKSNALMLRVECGDERGGLFQWSTNEGGTWIDEFNTIGVAGGSASPLFLGFAPGQSHVYIDDIVVERGADDRSPEPAPKPKPLPTRIEDLSEHFSEPSGDISPWILVPDENIREASTTEHPGMITIYQTGLGQDIKGLLDQPIRFDQYRVPWEFQLGMVQSFDAMLAAGAKTQANTAIGLNVALTFSDPSTWPEDRAQRPPDTRDYQLLVVHLGATGEAGAGLPQFADMPHPDTYLVWGRGDLGYSAMGDWNVPSIWVGDGGRRGGPANDQVFFRFRLLGPSLVQVGFRGDQSYAFHMRAIDTSQYGPITGVWEVGPIISCDRWIPDVLCRNLKPIKGWHDVGDLKSTIRPNGSYSYQWEKFYKNPDPEPPNPMYEYYVDYCAFFPSAPLPLEAYSDDFNILGYLGKWQAQPQGTILDTYSHPGHLTMTLIGSGCGTGFAPVGGSELDLSYYKPPFEIEIAFTAPDDTIPWNLWMNWQVAGPDGGWKGFWQPGVQNFPEEKRHVFINRVQSVFGQRSKASINVEFEEDPPESIMGAKPLYMLIQIIDPGRVRVGFRGSPTDPWYFSKVADVAKDFGGPIAKFGQHAFSTVTGRRWGAPPGGPMYQQFLVDYIDYRYGLSE